jgi:hypothetical protein
MVPIEPRDCVVQSLPSINSSNHWKRIINSERPAFFLEHGEYQLLNGSRTLELFDD